jgi:hypothetical protein
LGRDEERSLDCARDDQVKYWMTLDNSHQDQKRAATAGGQD